MGIKKPITIPPKPNKTHSNITKLVSDGEHRGEIATVG